MFFTDSRHRLGFCLCHLWNDSRGRPGGAGSAREKDLDKTWFSISSNYGRKYNSSFVTMSWHTLSEELDVWFRFEASIPVRIYQQIDQAVFVGDNKSL